jgi:anti-anti-sigma factor
MTPTQIQTPVEHKKNGVANKGTRLVLTPDGQITHSNCKEFQEKISDAILQNKTEIILDCNQVDLMDSAALELLNKTHEELKQKGGALKIIGLNKVCQDILLATRMINILFVYKNIHEAITNRP